MWEIGKNKPDVTKEFDRTVEYIYDTINAYKMLDRKALSLTKKGVFMLTSEEVPRCSFVFGTLQLPIKRNVLFINSSLIMGNTAIFKPAKLGVLLITHY